MLENRHTREEDILPPLVAGGRGNGFSAIARTLLSLSIAAVLALTVSACGKRGDPEPPDGEADRYPRQYPDPSSL
jgi:hypothetical protein